MAGDYILEVTVDLNSSTVTLFRDNATQLTVPFTAFPTCGDGTAPDFKDFSIVDDGQTLRFGDYEASVDAVLYEFDEDYRKDNPW